MFPISLTYMIAITLLTISPGVDTVMVIRNTTRGGWRDGAATSLGICCGLFVHATVSAVGISVILLQSAWAFRALKLAGAAYLVFLGIVSLRSAARRDAAVTLAREGNGRRPFVLLRSLREGFLCNVLNPKAVVFYMAFLPQFIDPAGSAIRQSLFLAGLHFLIAMVWQCLLAALVERARVFLGSRGVRRTIAGTVGALMLFFGIKLGLDR
jgi:threonine/homoserine/homoserine lactone efflux protein